MLLASGEETKKERSGKSVSAMIYTSLDVVPVEQLSRAHDACCNARAQGVLTAHHTPSSTGVRRDRVAPVLKFCLPIMVSSQKTTKMGFSASQDVLLPFHFFKHTALILCLYGVRAVSTVNKRACHLTGLWPTVETTMTVTVASPFSCPIRYLSVIGTTLHVPVWASKPYPEGEVGMFLRSFVRKVELQETACI